MIIQKAALIIGLLSNLVPVVAVYLRGRSRLLFMAAVLASASTSAYLITVIRLVQLQDEPAALPWVQGLVASAMPVLLSGFLISTSIGRDRPEESFRRHRRTFVVLGFLGMVFLAFLKNPAFITDYTWVSGKGTLFLGWIGKAYLSYLLIGIILIGYNLETTYRVSLSNLRPRLRLPFLAVFGLLGFFTFVLTTGMLYSTIGVGKLAASGLPILFANALVSYGFLRGSLTDVAAPVSRQIVYSSFTAAAAGFYVLAVGVVAQVATFTKWSPDEVVTLSLGFLAILTAVLLLFSNRFQRRVRRFIDRNFYVNRYDYRTQWSYVTRTLDEAHRQDDVLQQAARILTDVFLTDAFTISLKDHVTQEIRPRLGKGAGREDAILPEGSPLYSTLLRERRTLLLDQRPDDFEYIPIYAENRAWLASTATELTAPLMDRDEVIGTIGLERKHKDDPFTHEDATLLDSISRHVGAALHSSRLTQELAESREVELLANWSNMIVHDVKNHLAPLRMIAENLVTHKDRPGIQVRVAEDLTRVADKMESLVHTLSDLRGKSNLARDPIAIDSLVEDAVSEMQLAKNEKLEISLDLRSGGTVLGDPGMLKRVLENLLTNAVEAMNGNGKLGVQTQIGGDGDGNGSRYIVVSVTDTGDGIPDDFLRDGAFHPFATTKKRGLGLGLYQSRSIVRSHEGQLRVQSKQGQGTTFEMVLKALPPEGQEQEAQTEKPVPSEVFS